MGKLVTFCFGPPLVELILDIGPYGMQLRDLCGE